ncbi:transcriptional regulator [Mameliella alba]|uniref:Transcriptional regulator n=1 Tax=Mameliella alba TaxID=561184 RepID=A0A0B3RSH5_9RHOB|nr:MULTISPECIES: helix-turn-helix domain-containing protein [Mameliella]MBV6634359.1 helix-turn-helix domain-containing protein [Mameliella sp.]MCR9273570.1 helix-turn-helix domain-containing protein [Paracoccaceae bacterium]ODM49793.1 transcriptional regulator [Ruegeria sp. PBVC088]KHQ50912.1 Transcriptional regulator [Mameliella alba]MDD9733215.1 helix-turn-helix domain-containing protein [Mameliella sp. AT18]
MPLRTSQNESSELRKLDLFSDMEDAHFETLMRGAYVQNFPPAIELISEGEPSDFLHVVIEGSVELFAGWSTRETTMATVRPVSTFILAATIKDAPYLMSARTLEKSRIVLLPSSDVRAVFDQDQEFARAVVTELAQCYRHVVKHSKNLKLRTSLERLANYLIRCAETSKDPTLFDLPIEKRRLASFLGMTPENLSRAIKALKEYGVVINGQSVGIADDTDLRRLAKPTPLIDDPSH